MSKEVELLACPFCGAPAADATEPDAGVWIGCMNSMCRVMPYLSGDDVEKQADAVKIWNTRTAPWSAPSAPLKP